MKIGVTSKIPPKWNLWWKALEGGNEKGMASPYTRNIDLTTERLRLGCERNHKGNERPLFCSAPSLWPPMTSVIPPGGYPPSPMEAGTVPVVCSTCKYLLKPPYRNTWFLRLRWHSCGQLRSASSPVMDYGPDASYPLKILETTKNTSSCGETGSTKRDQREATTFEEPANISLASIYRNRYIVRKLIPRAPRHTSIFWFLCFQFCFFLVGGSLGEEETLSCFTQCVFFSSLSETVKTT